MRRIRVTGLVRAADSVGWRLHAGVVEAGGIPGEGNLAAIAADSEHAARRIRIASDDAGVGLADLPVRSRQAYLWLDYLSDAQNLRDVAGAMVRLLALEPNHGDLTFGFVRFYPAAVLFRSQPGEDGLDVTVHLAYVQADDSVLEAVARAAKGMPKALPAVKAFARSPGYRAFVSRLEARLGKPIVAPVGGCYDLEAVFQEVNLRYFQGAIEMPALRWGRRLTSRKMGSYDFARDTVTVSRTLDRPDVPRFVVEFVMYHELLHKALGVRVKKGRRFTHTPAFREAERAFVGFEEARRLLDKLPGRLD